MHSGWWAEPFETLRAGLRVSLPSILLGVVSLSNPSRTLSLSKRSNHRGRRGELVGR